MYLNMETHFFRKKDPSVDLNVKLTYPFHETVIRFKHDSDFKMSLDS